MAHGIEHGLKPTFWDGIPDTRFLHLGPRGSHDTEPEALAEQNLAADEKLRKEVAAEQIRKVLPAAEFVEYTD